MSDRKLTAPSATESRAFGRRSTVRHAWIVAGQRTRLPCCIRNLSVGGALLEFKVPEWLPYNFDLIVENPKSTIACEVRHRGIHGVGVAFHSPLHGLLLFDAQQTKKASPQRAAEEPQASRLQLSAAESVRGFRVPG